MKGWIDGGTTNHAHSQCDQPLMVWLELGVRSQTMALETGAGAIAFPISESIKAMING
jgi:hypothetical protein